MRFKRNGLRLLFVFSVTTLSALAMAQGFDNDFESGLRPNGAIKFKSAAERVLGKLADPSYVKALSEVWREQEADKEFSELIAQNNKELKETQDKIKHGPSRKLRGKIIKMARRYENYENKLTENNTCEEFMQLFVSEQMLGSFGGKSSKYVKTSKGYEPFVTRNADTGTIDRFSYGTKNGFIFSGHWVYDARPLKHWVVEVLRPDPKEGQYDRRVPFQVFHFNRAFGSSPDNDICQLDKIDLSVSGDFEGSFKGTPKNWGDTAEFSLTSKDCDNASNLASNILDMVHAKKNIRHVSKFDHEIISNADLYALMMCRPAYSQFFIGRKKTLLIDIDEKESLHYFEGGAKDQYRRK